MRSSCFLHIFLDIDLHHSLLTSLRHFHLQSLRIQQLDVVCETKTRDNVFVQVRIAVQYRVLLESAYDAYYRLSDPRGQIQSYVFDVVRSTVPKMERESSPLAALVGS